MRTFFTVVNVNVAHLMCEDVFLLVCEGIFYLVNEKFLPW